MGYFATQYTIHFDDTMAYGSHHFLTAFKFQCAARESFLFGEKIFDAPGVKQALNEIHLLTADAYARNLSPATLGDRVAILLTLEDWGRASARFCYRVIGERGQPICAGFQTLLCGDASSGQPILLPAPLWDAMEQWRDIQEVPAADSFRKRVLAGGAQLDSVFGPVERATAMQFLATRYPQPQVVAAIHPASSSREQAGVASSGVPDDSVVEAWVFAGQGAFDPRMLSERIAAYTQSSPSAREELDACAAVAQEVLQGNAIALVSGSSELCANAIEATPELAQVAIHLQNVLGARLRQLQGGCPAILMGHSFGEIAALGVGGCFDLPTGIRIVCERVRVIAEHAPWSGGLLAVSTDRASVATEATLLGLGQVVIAGRNFPRQTIVSGPLEQLEQLREYLRSIRVDAVNVSSPTSFHHPQLRLAAAAWLERLKTLPIGGPKLPVYSPIGRRFIPPNDDVATTLVSQLLLPFDLQGAVADVTQTGVTKFVDCGSTGNLARLLTKAGAEASESVAGSVQRPNVLEPTICSTRSTGGSMGRGTTRRREKSLEDDQPVTTNIQTTANTSRRTTSRVAIVGQGCLLPGGACTPERLYSAIMEQRSGIVDQRDFDPHWPADFYSEKLVPDRSTSLLTGRVDDEDIAAPDGIHPEVFSSFTRAQRLLCIALAPCIASLTGADRIVCLIGATADGFEDQDLVSSLRFAGIDPTEARVDQRLNTARSAFQQPHDAIQEVFDRVVRPGLKVILVDAACASSLYAVALGMHAIEVNEADAVVAGGVFCPGPGNSCLFSQFHGTTSTGCRPFDAHADGVVFSEGAALVTLRRLSDAEELGMPVSAVLRGVGLSSDGRSSSANVPQTHGQILSLERCYADYRIDPASIQAIEGHGTATPVGDATEVETLRRFFTGDATQPVPLHSLKGLIGHAGWAAGTASVIAVCEYLRRRRYPAQACFRESSPALQRAGGVVTVLDRPIPLPAEKCLIAIDGFGFGGANAHLVLESHLPAKAAAEDVQNTDGTRRPEEDELVFVALHEITPTVSSPAGMQFDRDKVTVPSDHVLLPDLEDDMDVSQTLAICLIDGIVSQLPEFDEDLRRATSVVVIQSGKTERSVEATMRVLAARLRRKLAGLDSLLEKVQRAYDRARPSGAYTLQCMMPNIAAGRGALRFNLNGPNFVVDAGSKSLEAAMSSASLLLTGRGNSGTKLVIVAAIEANSWSVARCNAQVSSDEFAAAFGVTTRSYAEDAGMAIVAPVQRPLQLSCEAKGPRQSVVATAQQIRKLLDTLTTSDRNADTPSAAYTSTNSHADSEFPIHVPVWVEAPSTCSGEASTAPREQALLAIVPAVQEQVASLLDALSRHSKRHLVVVVGPAAREVVSSTRGPAVTSLDLEDERDIERVLAQIDDFRPATAVAVEAVSSWELPDVLTKVATDNSICESLLLVAQHNLARLRNGALGLWGIFLDAWNGDVHPSSGAVAGMLKAVKREIAAARIGIVCTRGLSLDDVFERISVEQQESTREYELVYDHATRLVRRLRRVSETDEADPPIHLNSNSIVVATGGARGVTAVIVDALLRDYGCTVVALGRSSLEGGPSSLDDPNLEAEYYDRYLRDHPTATAADMKQEFTAACASWEAYRTVARLATVGGRIEYMVADVTDREQVAHVIREIAAKYGRIDLIIHGAGIQSSKQLSHRSLSDFRKTFSVKVSGLANLVGEYRTHFGEVPNAHMLTSAYSIFGNDGQHEYGAANETLDRLCALSTLKRGLQWSSVAWLAWDGIGMTRRSEYRALASQRGLSGLTAETGQRVLRRILRGRIKSANYVPMSTAEHVRYEVRTVPPATAASTKRILEVPVELMTIECLPHHRIRSAPTLPGAWILERMAEAALKLYENLAQVTSVTIRNATFHRFVRYVAGREPNLRVIVEETADSVVAWMVGDILNSSGATLSRDHLFAEAKFSFHRDNTVLQSSLRHLGAPEVEGISRLVSDPYCDGRDANVELSGPFDCVRDIAISPTGRRARVVPRWPQKPSEVIPAFLLDSAWRVGAMHAVPEKNELYVPLRIGRVVATVGANGKVGSTATWEIRATAPRVENGCVRWDRTEAFNDSGSLQLIVDDAIAAPLH